MRIIPWKDSRALGARWGEEVAAALGLEPDTALIYDYGEHYYQGSASFIARTKRNEFVIYAWSYGSCSGCDSWEGQEETIAPKVQASAKRVTRRTLIEYLRGIAATEGEYGRPGAADAKLIIVKLQGGRAS